MLDFIQPEQADLLKIIRDTRSLFESVPDEVLFLPDPKKAELALLRAYSVIDAEMQRRVANHTLTEEENDAFQKLVSVMRPLYQKAIRYKSVARQFKGLEIRLVN